MTTPKSRRDKAMKLNELLKPRPCIVCGARVKNMNPRTNTCDPTCTRAKHANRTRQEQIEHEMAIDEYNDCMAGHAHLWQPTDEIGVKRKARI